LTFPILTTGTFWRTVKVNAQLIVARNLKDSPGKDSGQWDIRPKSPDNFAVT
jgi:hypothetical protein